MKSATRCLALLVVACSLLFFALVPRFELLEHDITPPPTYAHRARQLPFGPSDSSSDNTQSTPVSVPTTTPPVPTPTPTPTPTSTPTTTTTTSTTTTSSTTTTTTPTSPTSTPPVPTTPLPTSAPLSSSSTQSISTAPQGTDTVTATATTTSSSASASATGGSSDSSSGLSTGSIVGMSVAGGVAVIGIIAFCVWKFTRKRFTDFDDNEAIKWPELNSHAEHALPTTATGRSGFGDDSSLTRAQSNRLSAYASSLATTSTPEFYQNGGGPDPYAVPPLPHLNPNQSYHDDPGYGIDPNSFYDPYRGPVPDSVAFDGAEAHQPPVGYGGEAIPMTQMARTRSPGPGMAFDTGRASPSLGRQSPGPQIAMGRQSPGPHMGYGGPMDGGRMSPGSHAAYAGGGGYDDGYGAR